MGYATKAVRGAASLSAAAFGQQFTLLLANIVLARILTKSDFETVALVVAIMTLLDVFAELGVSVALVRQKTLEEKTLGAAFTATISSTLFISSTIFFSSNILGGFFNSSILPDLLKIAAFSFIFKGIMLSTGVYFYEI